MRILVWMWTRDLISSLIRSRGTDVYIMDTWIWSHGYCNILVEMPAVTNGNKENQKDWRKIVNACILPMKKREEWYRWYKDIRAATPTVGPNSRASSSWVSKGGATSQVWGDRHAGCRHLVSQEQPRQGVLWVGLQQRAMWAGSALWCWRGKAILWNSGGDGATPVALECRASVQRGIFSSIRNLQNCSCYVLDLRVACHPFLLCYFPLFEWEYLSYTCHTTVFWKHITSLVSQVRSWRAQPQTLSLIWLGW